MIREESCVLCLPVSVQCWRGGYGPMKRGGRCGCGCGWMMLRGGGGGEDEMSVDVLFCEGGVSGMELWLVVGGCESIERG